MKDKKGSRMVQGRGERIFDIAVTLLCILICIIAIYPIYYTVIASISKPLFVENGTVMLAPHALTLESYKKACNIDGLWVAYGNTIFYTVVGTTVSMIFTTTMAYGLSRKRLIGRKPLTLFVVFTMWFNAGLIPTYMNFKDLGLLNTRTAIILGFALSAYNLVIMKSFFEQLPESLEEAALIDGASNLRTFWSIFLPLSKPALATVGMFYAVGRWNNYFWAMNLIKDDKIMPLQVLLKKLIVEQVSNTGDAALVTPQSLSSPTTVIYAVIVIAIIPMLIVYPFIQKYFKTGVTLGAVKG